MFFIKIGFVIFFSSFLFFPIAQAQNSIPADLEEVFLLFSYQRGAISEVVVAQQRNGLVYLPFIDIFRLLQINYTADRGMTGISGFFINPQRRYEIDLQRLLVRIDTTTLTLRESEIIRTELGIYLLPSIFKKIFGLRFAVEMARLQLSMETDEVLPIVAEREREQRRQFLRTVGHEQKEYPLLFGRDRSLFRAGVLDYSLTGMREEGATFSAYNFQTGSEFMGGELNASLNGGYNQNRWSTTQHDLRWRYVFGNTRMITQTVLGTVNGIGISQAPFTGVSISNEPLIPRTLYQTTIIEEQTQPFWIVELYLNEQLTAAARADETGRVRFEIPLTYGTNVFLLRKYGPSGEMIAERRRIQVPFAFLPLGEINYSVNAGRLKFGEFPLYQAQAVYGLSGVFTDRIAVEYLHDTLRQRPVFTNVVSARIGENVLLALEASPAVRYRADLEIAHPSQISYGLSYTRFETDRFYNPLTQRSNLQANGTIPIEFENYHFTLRGIANQTVFLNSSNLFWTVGATISRGAMNVTVEQKNSELEYEYGSRSAKPGIDVSALYSIGQHGILPFNLNSFLLGATASYDQSVGQIGEVTCDLSANIFTQGRIRIGYRHDFLNTSSVGFLELTFDFDFARSSASFYAGNRNAYSQSFSGALVYASDINSVSAYGRQWNNNAGANFRMFLDENGNDRCDEGEKIIEGGSVSIGQSASLQKSGGGLIKIWELMPYARYQTEILDVAISNNLWIPKHKAFAFIADPHRAKTMDIPFVAVGMIEGTVFRMRKNERVPIPGLKVDVVNLKDKSKKTISLFQDGSLYYVGLAPGKYKIYIDSAQLRILGLLAKPPMREFKIKTTADGDAVSGLDFILEETDTLDRSVNRGAHIMPNRRAERAREAKASVQQNDSLQIAPSSLAGVASARLDAIRSNYPVFDTAMNESLTHLALIMVKNMSNWIVYTSAPGRYMVQISSWTSKKKASVEAEKFTKRYHRPTVLQRHWKNGKLFHAIQFGPFPTYDEARAAIDERNEQDWLVYTSMPGKYMVQISSWTSKKKASVEAEKFTKRYHHPAVFQHHLKNGKLFHAIQFGPFPTYDEAIEAINECRDKSAKNQNGRDKSSEEP